MARTRYNPGKLDQRVSFVTMTQGADGRPVESVVLSTWAFIRQASGIRTDQAGEINLTKELVLTIRYRDGFFPEKTMLVDWNNRRYVITSVPPNIDKRFVEVRLSYED